MGRCGALDKRKLNRITWMFVTVTVLVVALMLMNTLRRSDRITLPEPGGAPDQTVEDTTGSALTVVEVTPETVQAAVRTLTRPDSYRRTVTVEQFWDGGSGTYSTAAAVSGDWTRTDRALPDGRTRHAITNGEDSYIWYDQEDEVYAAPAGGITADQEQTIPTYEDILTLPEDSILVADYRTISDVNCIYVETAAGPEGYALRYWVAVDTGLLSAAEKLQNGETVYRMAALSLDGMAPTTADFTLPDGTVLAQI